MQKHPTFFSLLSMITLMVSAVVAQEPMKKARELSVGPAASGNPVTGSGTAGRISKWTGVFGSNTFTLGDTNIFEDKFGKVGIGTDAPTSKLTVQGMIETTLGGIKFPDGTVQTTAGLASIFHDSTLTGNGTAAMPLGVSVPLILNGSIPSDGVIQATNSALFGRGVVGNGGAGGPGVQGRGGPAIGTSAGVGVSGDGGESSNNQRSGTGVFGSGGNNNTGGEGGVGVFGRGGFSSGPRGGTGVFGQGASGSSGVDGGPGVIAQGGQNTLSGSGDGGSGLLASGGAASGVGKSGGIGVEASGGIGDNGATPGLAGKFKGDVQIIGNTLVTSAGKGIILKSPDGATCRLLSIDNAGNIVLTDVTCP